MGVEEKGEEGKGGERKGRERKGGRGREGGGERKRVREGTRAPLTQIPGSAPEVKQ